MRQFFTYVGGQADVAGQWDTIQSSDLPGGSSSASYQFTPESYGAKRDGRFLYDAKMTNGSAVLTTAGLPAPAGPGLSSGSGTVGAGTYQVEVTYVNQFGETLASSASSITVGASSSITVTSPAPWTNATAYYVYCTQAGGSSFTRQQAPGSPTSLDVSYTITAPPTNTGAAPPAANTSNSAPFTAADVGKAIMVPSAAGFLNGCLVTTIASYQSATQVTLSASCTTSAGVTGYGAAYGTDDTAAVQAAINAAVAYAQTAGSEQATGEVLFGDGIYCIAGPLGGTYQNSQLRIPYIDPYSGPQVRLKLTGVQEAAGPAHWNQPNPPAGGTVLLSFYYSDNNAQAFPQPAVIAGPMTTDTSNMRVIVDGINVLVAYRCSIAGLDLMVVGQADIKSFSYFPLARTSGAAGGWPPYMSGNSNPSPWQVFGYRTPTTGNNAQNDLDRITVYGPYHGVIYSDHFAAGSIRAVNCYYATTAGNASNAHHCTIVSLLSELTSVPIYCDNTGTYGSGAVALTVASLHVENADFIISDPGNLLWGEVHAESLGLTGAFAGGKNGAANIKLVWDHQTLGHVASPPAVPGSPATVTNTFWQPATVTIHTGAGVTVSAIALDGTATGMTMAASSSLAVPVRNGGTIGLTFTGGTPTWDWWLG